MELPFAESYKIKMVEAIRKSTTREREEWIKNAGYNVFNLLSDQVYIDLLTDSGTGAMSDLQWSALMQGDESYAGSSSYHDLKEVVREITGFSYFLPTHQGRAAENVLFSAMVKKGDVVPGNSHFDTTRGHIEFRNAVAADCTIDAAFDTSAKHPFKGNIDLAKLETVLKTYPAERIPFVIVTVTCNSSGGQPVSMENLKGVRMLANKYDVPVVYDAARFAENAYFIKVREKGYKNKSIREIAGEMFSLADAMTMSCKKDGIVNMGGFIGLNDEELFKKASVFNIMFEGYITYGGMSGRDMSALARGLIEGTEFDYLQTRINQVYYLGERLKSGGIPLQEPFGGHAIFVDAKRFFPHIPKEEFVAQALVVELFLESGVRASEIGTLLADRDPVTRENRYPETEFLRLAIPRRVYTNNHMDVVATALKNIFERRDSIKRGFRIINEAPILRHFTVELDRAAGV